MYEEIYNMAVPLGILNNQRTTLLAVDHLN